jgi:hypothetical protein
VQESEPAKQFNDLAMILAPKPPSGSQPIFPKGMQSKMNVDHAMRVYLYSFEIAQFLLQNKIKKPPQIPPKQKMPPFFICDRYDPSCPASDLT